MFSCNCLNISIESAPNEFPSLTTDLLNLTKEEKLENFFRQELVLADKSIKINEEYSELVTTRSVGSMILYHCINCDVETHTVHQENKSKYVVISAKLLTGCMIEDLRNDKFYSKAFRIVVQPDSDGRDKLDPENLAPEVVLSLDKLKQRMCDVIEDESEAADKRAYAYRHEQYTIFEKFRARATREQRILIRIILEKRSTHRDDPDNNNLEIQSN